MIIFWYDLKLWFFSRWNIEKNICTLWKIHIYSRMTNKKMWYIEAIIFIFNNKLQKISFKNSFMK
jgi:hypothetical protein